MNNKAYMVPNPLTPNQPVRFNYELCIGCNNCVEVCRTDVIVPNREKRKPPIVLYPDECWYCGCCVDACKVPGAIIFIHPLNQRIGWKRKETGEYFRVGMKNPQFINNKQPIGDLKQTQGGTNINL
ncbi:4Fe-4S dicluster domain-containing protein [Moorella sulfitireducens]|uniref:4Fe-4S dicluster domain-containing protein n=1 Tax=Neomoorella sulfitireducens TaxID=2972948 RepID=UPI0021ACFC29|nr:ferredoxin family protein [Moorella sulfitireducens]